MAYPTTLALITALWSGPARTKSIALWAAIGGAISALGPLCSGILLEHFWWGSVFLLTLPLAVIALVMAVKFVPRARQRDDRAGRQPRRRPLDRPRGRADPRDQLRAGAERDDARRSACSRSRPSRWSSSSSGSGGPRTRCTTCDVGGPADLLGGGVRRPDRVRLADGRDVHRPAVPAERARLLDRRRRAAILPAAVFMVVVAPRSAKLVEARGARLHAALRLRLRAARLPHDAAALEGGHLATGRSRSATRSSASASASPARRPRTR